jgi:predicted ferric reductase
LILQPTHTAEQKRTGAYIHAAIQDLAVACLIAGLVIIEINKYKSHREHFESPHAIMGMITYVSVILQALIGAAQFFTPGLFGGVDNAKAIYKYHRWAGYAIFTFGLATVCAATQTDYNKDVLGIQLWAIIVASVITLAGLLPRIKKQKLGL